MIGRLIQKPARNCQFFAPNGGAAEASGAKLNLTTGRDRFASSGLLGEQMSQKYQNPADVPTEIIAKRLEELSDAVAKGREGDGEFTMRVPPEVDRDADIVLSEAARRLKPITEDQLIETIKKHQIELHWGAQYSIKCQFAQLLNLVNDLRP